MSIRFKLYVTIDGVDVTNEHFAECCGQGCGTQEFEELSQCLECGKRFCMKHDCECPVDTRDE
jgi:hypothetical protein